METDQLPVDKFNGYWNYHWNECKYSIPLRMFVVVGFGFFIIAGIISCDECDQEGVHVLGIFGIICNCIAFCMPLIDTYDPHDYLGVEGHIKYFFEITQRKPTMEARTWHEISLTMNQFVKENKLTRTGYLFYDEKSCQDYFIRLVENHFQRKRYRAEQKKRTTLIKISGYKPKERRCEAQEYSDCNEQANPSSPSSSPSSPSSSPNQSHAIIRNDLLNIGENPIDNKIIRKSFKKARKVYQKQTEIYWNNKYPELHIRRQKKRK